MLAPLGRGAGADARVAVASEWQSVRLIATSHQQDLEPCAINAMGSLPAHISVEAAARAVCLGVVSC